MIKKLLLIPLLFSLLMVTGFSATEYLNSCGKNSGWTSNTEYIINFDYVDDSYANDYCFSFPKGTYNNISFNQSVDTLTINRSSTFYLFNKISYGHTDPKSYIFNNYHLYNLNINSIGAGSLILHYFHINANYNGYLISNIYNNPLFENITINSETLGHFFYINPINSENIQTMDSAIFNNVFLNNLSLFTFSSTRVTTMNYDNITISNSYINTPNTYPLYFYHRLDTLSGTKINNLTIKNTFFGSQAHKPYFIAGSLLSVNISNYFTNFEDLTDNDDDNLADEVGLTFTEQNNFAYTPVISFATERYNVFYSVKEAQGVFNLYSGNDNYNIFTSSENFPDSKPFVSLNTNSKPSSFLGDYNIIDDLRTVFGNSGINCDIIFGDKCYLQDKPSFSETNSNPYRPLIGVFINSVYNNIDFKKIGDLNNGQILANYLDNTLNNITITNNNFFKSDSQGLTNMIKLKANNVLIKNNVFKVDNTNDNTTEYYFLYLESLNKNTNVITENKFLFNTTESLLESEVFNSLADTKFYNNYIGSQVVLSNTPIVDFETNPLSTYVYNNNIYYFNIGNYYEDNTGCIDSDSNGICDSNFTSGAFTDTAPLSEYPFDYYAHLVDASIVSSLDFNVNLSNINDNDTIEVSDLQTSQVIFQFTQDSDLPDLTCNLILDGASITSVSNPTKNDIINFSGVTGWTEKTYTLRVECANNDAYESSQEISFNIIENSNNGGNNTGGNTTGGSNNTGNLFDVGDNNIIGSDVTQTSDNAVSFVSQMVNGLTGIALPIGAFLIAIFVILGVVALFR